MRSIENTVKPSNFRMRFRLLLLCMLVSVLLLEGFGRVSAQQVPPEADARLSDLSLIAAGAVVTPTPAFDPDITRYAATITSETVNVRAVSPYSDAVIDQITVAGETTVLDSPSNLLDTNVDVVEGAITPFSLRVVAEDGITTKTYYIDFSRPAADTVPDITIAADPSQYVAGLGVLEFTLTREGSVSDLDVTVRISQDQPWLSSTSYAVTFEDGEDEAFLLLFPGLFSSDVTQSGDLVAIVDAVDNYDTSGARSQVEVISQEGPAVTVALEKTAYAFDEDIGEAKVVLVARAAPGVPKVPSFSIAVVSADQSATAGAVDNPLADYLPVSSQIPFLSSDFQDDEGSLVGRKEVPIAIVDDNVHEGDELFYLHLGATPGLSREVRIQDASGNRCSTTCADPYPVTITDDDPPPAITINAPEDYLVGWGNLRFRLTRAGDLSESLDVTVNLQQTRPWLSTTSHIVTFDADDPTESLILTPGDFSNMVTESGELTATVSMVDGYDTSGATATVRVYPYDGSVTVRVSLDSPSYAFPEDAGEVKIQVVARPEAILPFVPEFFVGISSEAGTASSPGDYEDFSKNVEITNADFVLENGQQVGRVDVPVTILDDSKYEGDETFSFALEWSPGVLRNVILVDPEGNDCDLSCELPFPATITDNDPAPNITAPEDYLVGWDNLRFTLTRTGDITESLDVTVDFDQTQPWLSTTSYTVTFEAEDDTATLTLAPGDFSATVTESGELTATVDGHDTGGSTTTVRVHPYDGSPVRVSLDSAAYTFPEDAGTVNLKLVASPDTNLPFVPTFAVGVSTAAGTAASPDDYEDLSTIVSITNADFVMESGLQIARVDVPVTIVDDAVYEEEDEQFNIRLFRPGDLNNNVLLLDASNNPCDDVCANLYVVTITDDDPVPNDLLVGLQHTRTDALTREDAGRDEYTIDVAGGTQYIIEVKHPLKYVPPGVETAETQPSQVPGYLVDPSILEITGHLHAQVTGEHDNGGFVPNYARAFFKPTVSGTYRVAVGAGAQDRSALGGYTISIRVDDHADDFKTDPDVVLRPGESITAGIDSDVAPEHLDLNEAYWGARGIETLDDRDVIRFEIPDEGIYQLAVTGQPTGVGIRYIWDHLGNLYADALDDDDQPAESTRYSYDPGVYYVEIGSPYESEANTGEYTLILNLVSLMR